MHVICHGFLYVKVFLMWPSLTGAQLCLCISVRQKRVMSYTCINIDGHHITLVYCLTLEEDAGAILSILKGCKGCPFNAKKKQKNRVNQFSWIYPVNMLRHLER